MNFAGKSGSHAEPGLSAHFHNDSPSTGANTVIVPDAHLLFSGDYARSGTDLVISDQFHRVVVPNYFNGDKRPALVSAEGAPLDPKFIDALTGHVQYAQAAGTAAAPKVIGHVVKMTGSASIVRNGVTIDLNNGDNVYQSDVVQTGSGSTLGLVMIDGTTFNLTANARLMMNDLTYDATSTSNTALFTLVQGAANFVAGQVAKSGDMKVSTPVATMGIRGTAVILDVSSTDGTVSVSVVNQRDGQVHAVQVFNARGDLIGTVTSNGSSLTLTPTASFEVIAQESNKTVAQVLTEFNAFQQLLSTYDIGKQLIPNTPAPTDGRRGDNTQQPFTKFALGSSSPLDNAPVKNNGDGGGPKDVKGGGAVDPLTVKPTGEITDPVKVTLKFGDDAPIHVDVAATSIPFVVTPSPVSRISSGPGDHFGPVMSADGQFVTYDPDGAIYLFDRQTGTTKTIASPGAGLTYGSPTISSDGHFIVYQGSDGTQSWIFIYNNDASDPAHYGQITRLMSGGQPAISGDGSKIVVEHGGGIGLYDQQGHELANFSAAVISTAGTLWKPAISADGHIVAFWSSDLSSPGGAGQLFTYDLSTATIRSIASTATDAGNSAASFSADGHYVVYQSDAPGGHSEIYLYDLRAGEVVFHTANPEGSYSPVLSPDGHFIIMASDAQLTADDKNDLTDIYVIDVTDPSHPVYKLVSVLDDGTQGNDASNLGATISAGGQFIAFGSRASNFSTGDGPGSGDIFVVDPTSGHSAIILESHNSPAVLTTSGVIKLTGEHSGITLGVSDSRITASFDAHGDIQWSFSEPRSDFASLQPGQISVQDFVITLSTDRSTTEIPLKVSIYDVDQPPVPVTDAAPVASPVTLAAGAEDARYTITSAALLAGVVDIDGPSLSISAVGILSGGGAIVDNHNGTFSYTPAPNYNGPVVFSYTASDGTLSASSTAILNIAAVNDAPVVTKAVTGGGAEGSGIATVNLLNFASDVDAGAALHVANLVWTDTGSGFPAGVTLSADGNSLLVDTNNPAYDHLAQGASFAAHFSYDVVDEHGALVHQTATVTIGGTNDAPVILQTAGLLGIGFNSSINQNFVAAMDAGSGAVTTLNNFAFDSGFWNPFSLTASDNDLYALSATGVTANGSLYDFDATTGALKSVVAVSVEFQGLRAESNGTLIGIGYNSIIGKNFIATIDPHSGAVTTLSNFAFDSGAWSPTTLTVSGNDLYALSAAAPGGHGSLYDFNATTGALKSVVTVSVEFQGLRAESNGTLIGIGYNSSIGQNFIATVDPLTGAVTTLNNFAFDSGAWIPSSLTVSGNDLYALSSGPAVNGSLYDFDATTGALKSVAPAGTQFQALTAGGHGSGAVSTARMEGSGTSSVNLLQNAFDVDDGAVLHVANLVRTDGGGMPAGFTLSPDGNSISVDTDSPVYNSLAQGQAFTAHFGYDVVDEHGASVHQTATVTIAGTNDAPTLTRAALTIAEGATVVLAAADIGVTDPDSTHFTFTVSGVSHGTFQITGDGTIWIAATTFTTADLNAGHVRFVHDGGKDAPAFSIQANDGAGSNSLSNVVAGSVTFTNVDHAPVAVPDTGVSITENGGVAVSFSPILNASATGVGSEYVITQALDMQVGALWSDTKISLNTSFTISADLFFGADPGGADGFSFIIQNQSKTAIGAVGGGLGYQGIGHSVAIEFDTYDNGPGYNDIPDDHAAFDVNGSMSGIGGPIDLGNIEDGQYHPVTISWNAATHVITLSYDGVVIGTQTIDVAATVGSDEAYIGFAGSTGAENNLQKIRDLNYQSADSSVVLDVLANDTDADPGDKATLHLVSASSAGGASLTFSGLAGAGIVYSPGHAFDYLAAGQTATDTVTYTIADSHGAQSTSTAQVTIIGLNDAPVITSDGGGATASVSVAENTNTVTMVHATDVDSANLSYSIVTGDGSPDAAKFSIDHSTGALAFVKAPDFENPGDSNHNNIYTVQVNVSDGDLADTQTIFVHVTDVNEAPHAVNDVVITNNADNSTYQIPAWALLANDTDPDGNALSLDAITHSSEFASIDLTTNPGNVTIHDRLVGGSFTYSASDGSLHDTADVTVTQDTGTMNGGSGNEIFIGDSNGTTINANGGNDILIGNAGNDTLNGGSGNDTYVFGLHDGRDVINDTGGLDTIRIEAGGAALSGLSFAENATHDLVIQFDGQQVTVDDHFIGDHNVGGVLFDGGASYDGYSLGSDPYFLSNDGGSSRNGASGNDILSGDGTANSIGGGDGNDLLFGNAGNDTLNGGYGNDLLVGGSGNDFMTGGPGNDTFVFAKGSGHDTVADFAPGQDHISLDYHAFDVAAGPNDFSHWLAAHATISGSSDVLIDLNVDGLHPGVDTILFKNVALANLHAGDFIVHPLT